MSRGAAGLPRAAGLIKRPPVSNPSLQDRYNRTSGQGGSFAWLRSERRGMAESKEKYLNIFPGLNGGGCMAKEVRGDRKKPKAIRIGNDDEAIVTKRMS